MALGYQSRNDQRKETLIVEGTLIGETDRSWKGRFPNCVNHVWLPKSQVEYDESGGGSFIIPRWLAEKEGLA